MTASDSKLPEPDLSGQTIDRYHLLRRIGVGGMGAVYEAEHTRLRKRFAVKLLRYDLARDETFRRRFLREARAASAITHPNVVAISDFGETDDQVFFVMEMLAGRDLQDLLDEEGKLPWPRTRDILGQITSALQAAHLQDIIHRDMKPSNVFLADVPGKGDEDVVKVLDFGIAKLSGNMGEATVKLTSTDEIFGTVAYMAPEMAMGVNDDRRSDVYAVGVMMYRMLTGALPFTQGNAFQILSQHINAPLPPPREKEPSIPAPVEAILLRALAKRPEERFASMEELGRALRRDTLEATEALVGLHTEVLVGTPKLPSGSPLTLDKTTPLPAIAATPTPAPSAPPLATEVSAPLVDSAAVPLEVAPTIVSKPIAVAPSDSAAAPQPQIHAPPSAPVATDAAPPDEPRSLLPRFLLLAVGVGAIAAVITMLVLRDPEPTPAASPTQTADVVPTDAKRNPPSVASTKVEPTPAPEGPVDAPKPDPVGLPAPAPASASDPPTTDATEPAPAPADSGPTAQDPPKPKPTKPRAKPKTDAEIVAALEAKLAAKCKDTGATKVKVEGMITSSGSTTGLLITPPTGPGACASTIVTAAKFDPTPGPRPIPRFSVEL